MAVTRGGLPLSGRLRYHAKVLRYRRATLLAAIEGALRPVVGDLMASAAVKAHVKQLGIEGEWVGHQRVTLLLQSIDKGTRVFVGARRSGDLIAQIWGGLTSEDDTGVGEFGISVEYMPSESASESSDVRAWDVGETPG